MEKLKFALFSIVTLVLLGLFGYWSINTIQSGREHATDQKIKTLEKANADLTTEVKKLTSELGISQSKLAEFMPSTPKESAPIVYQYQSLIDELQKLIDGNVSLKLKSRGTNAGTVQKFLNIYNNTSNQVDNDYGAGTVRAITAFQKDSGITANGEAGSETFNEMIDWLKKQV